MDVSTNIVPTITNVELIITNVVPTLFKRDANIIISYCVDAITVLLLIGAFEVVMFWF